MRYLILVFTLLLSCGTYDMPSDLGIEPDELEIWCYDRSCVAEVGKSDGLFPDGVILCDPTGCYCLRLTKKNYCYKVVLFTSEGVREAFDNGCCVSKD